MSLFFTRRHWAGLILTVGFALSGCADKNEVRPGDEPCATVATVRLRNSQTARCCAGYATLELADGTRLVPSGPVWQAYQAQPADGQLIRISYEVVPRITDDCPGYVNATLSCLEENRD